MTIKPLWLQIATKTVPRHRRPRRTQLRASTKGRCYYCGFPTFDRYHALDRDWLLPGGAFEMVREHRVPLSRGGGLTAQNSVPACSGCNLEKGPLTADEFRTFRGLRSGDLNYRFAFDAQSRRRDWIVVHSRKFEPVIMRRSHPGIEAAYAMRIPTRLRKIQNQNPDRKRLDCAHG